MSQNTSKTFTNELIQEKAHKVLDFLLFWSRPIRVGDLVKQLSIKHSTMNSILHRLRADQLVKWEAYGLVELTNAGREYASHLSNHHFIIEEFLRRSLDLPEEIIHQEALHLAGAFSCRLVDAICQKYRISHEELNKDYCSQRDYLIESKPESKPESITSRTEKSPKE